MTVANPGIIWYGCHPLNTSPRPADIYYEGICLHTTAGGSTIEGLAAWFNGGNIQAGMRGSTTHGVDRAGKIGGFVQPYTNVMPIANGQESGSTTYLVRVNPGISANAYTLNIEHLDAGTPGSLTDIQFQRTIHLCAYLWQEFIQPYAHITNAVIDLDHIVQHRDFAPASRPFCASWPQARMQTLINGMVAMLAPPKPEPEPVPPDPEPEPVPPHDEWKYRFSVLADESAQWNIDDAEQADWAVALRQERIQAIARGEI
jgi:hypothetical protein